MGWNTPGGDNNSHDPWGGGNKHQGPPDIDKLIAQFLSKLRRLVHFKPTSGNWQPQTPKDYHVGIGVVILVFGLLWFVSGLYIINPAEQAVILRFGQFSEIQNPGLHWLARFVDTKYTVDVQKINSFALQGDFLTKSAEQGDLPNQVIPVADTKTDSDAINTSDKSKNLVDVEMTVQYRISDPRAYLFSVVDPDNTIQEVAAGALSEVVGKMKLDDVLTTGRELLSSGVLERTKQVLNAYGPGLEVVAVTLRKVQAPEQVQVAFNDVNRADQEKATFIQQAQAYASKIVPLAQGNAARTLADARAYQQQAVLSAQAQVAKFQALLSVYKSAPDLTRQRMYLETMQAIFQSTSKILMDTGSANNVLYLPIEKFLQNAKAEETTANEAANQSTNLTAVQMNDANNSSSQDQSTDGGTP